MYFKKKIEGYMNENISVIKNMHEIRKRNMYQTERTVTKNCTGKNCDLVYMRKKCEENYFLSGRK